MAFKVVIFATFLVAANAGNLGVLPVGYAAPAHVGYSAPLGYAGPGSHVTFAAPAAHYSYSAPAAHVAYAAPAAHYGYAAPSAHLAYAAPAIAKVAGPLAYAAPAVPLAYAAPAVAKIAAPVLTKTVVAEEYDSNPQYSYAYNIQDALTGDNKNQYESRSGDVVQGSYSLNDADGTRRTVEYTADPVNGFNAVVHKEPLVAKVAAAPLALAAAPIAKIHQAPLAYQHIY